MGKAKWRTVLIVPKLHDTNKYYIFRDDKEIAVEVTAKGVVKKSSHPLYSYERVAINKKHQANES